jgi:hypothetical protein
MLLIDHILHKNHIFNNVRFWEDRHFVDILGISHLLHGKVIFELLFFLLFLSLSLKKNNYLLVKYKERERKLLKKKKENK